LNESDGCFQLPTWISVHVGVVLKSVPGPAVTLMAHPPEPE
jgi:hypothetical protein